jgi:SAM-dependent methyltransferase
MNTVWHDLECGGYAEDLSLWRTLATEFHDPILEIGTGTGRVAIELSKRGHHVTALDNDRELLVELERRAAGLKIETALADARSFKLQRRFALCLVPMQTIQLFGGAGGRAAFLSRARDHLVPGGVLAAAIAPRLETFETSDDAPFPVPDMCERDGIVYASRPTAVRALDKAFLLERRRETVALDGSRSVERNVISLDRLTARELEREAAASGFRASGRQRIAPTSEYAGSEVVILRV